MFLCGNCETVGTMIILFQTIDEGGRTMATPHFFLNHLPAVARESRVCSGLSRIMSQEKSRQGFHDSLLLAWGQPGEHGKREHL
jgi:hypothetical protein